MEGKIKWYNPKNGYGFIAGEDGADYFVHFTAIPQGVKIYPNDVVSFDAVDTEKGKQAQNIQKIGEAEPEDAADNNSTEAQEETTSQEDSASQAKIEEESTSNMQDSQVSEKNNLQTE